MKHLLVNTIPLRHSVTVALQEVAEKSTLLCHACSNFQLFARNLVKRIAGELKYEDRVRFGEILPIERRGINDYMNQTQWSADSSSNSGFVI